MSIQGRTYGITQPFEVQVPTSQRRFAVAGASPDTGSLTPVEGERSAASFVEDLFRQGRVAVSDEYLTDSSPVMMESRLYSHEIIPRDGRLTLARRLFD